MKKRIAPKLINKDGKEFHSLFGAAIVRRAETSIKEIANE
jgi:hypothetical protein